MASFVPAIDLDRIREGDPLAMADALRLLWDALNREIALRMATTTPGSGSAFVSGPGTSTPGDLASYTDTTGKKIADSGVPAAQVARKDQANTFANPQTINAGLTVNYETIQQAGAPQINFVDTSAPANARRFSLYNQSQVMELDAQDDTGAYQARALMIDRAGNTLIGGQLTATGLASTPLNATNLTSGSVPDARLSSNVPLKNAANTFTQAQTISGAGPSVVPAQFFVDTAMPANQKVFRWLNNTGTLRLNAFNDDTTTPSTGAVPSFFDRVGNFTAGGDISAGGTQVTGGNVARRDQTNTFTVQQTIQTAGGSQLNFINTASPTDQKVFRQYSYNGNLYIDHVNDAISAVISTPLTLNNAGDVAAYRDIYEKQRGTPLGHWIPQAFSAGNFGADGGAWTISNQVANAYSIVGKTCIWNLWVQGTLAAASGLLIFVLPGGLTSIVQSGIFPIPYLYTSTGEYQGLGYCDVANRIVVRRAAPQANIPAGACYVAFSIAFFLP